MPDLVDQNSEESGIKNSVDGVCSEIDSFLGNKEEYANLSGKYVQDRLSELKKGPASPKELALGYSSNWHGFIHNNTEIHANMMFDGFVLDDNDIYSELLGVMHEMHNNPTWTNESAKSMTGQAIDIVVNKYFANRFSDDSVSARRTQIYSDNSHIGQKAFSIKALKGKEAAECVEKAALGNNLFCFLGYDSELIFSKHTKIESDKEEPHAYLYVNNGKTKRIVDLTNPSCAFDTSGKLLSARVAVYTLSQEQQTMFEGGKEIAITHNDYIVGEDGSKMPKSSTRVYSPS